MAHTINIVLFKLYYLPHIFFGSLFTVKPLYNVTQRIINIFSSSQKITTTTTRCRVFTVYYNNNNNTEDNIRTFITIVGKFYKYYEIHKNTTLTPSV